MDGASTPQTNGRTNGQTTASLPQETIDFAGKVFNLARQGGDELLGTYLEAGLPAKTDTLAHRRNSPIIGSVPNIRGPKNCREKGSRHNQHDRNK